MKRRRFRAAPTRAPFSASFTKSFVTNVFVANAFVANVFMTAIAAATLTFGFTPSARADEDDDIQRQIDTQKAGVPDLEHLDALHAATADIQRLRDWLGQAWDLRNKHEPDAAREVLDRCSAQSELIRQIIAASRIKADVAAKEAKLKKTRETIEKTKRALQEAEARKNALREAVGS